MRSCLLVDNQLTSKMLKGFCGETFLEKTIKYVENTFRVVSFCVIIQLKKTEQ